MNILEMDLKPEDEKLLRESLESWKEEVYSKLLTKTEEAKERKIEELEEANIEYREELKKEYSDKLLSVIKEMREEIKAETLAEMVTSNPEIQILEKIKELVAPTLNEDFVGNVYAEEIQTLREENVSLKEEMELEEGAKTLAELIAPYSTKTQNLLLSIIPEGNSDEVTEKFYEIIESLNEAEEEDEVDDEDDEEKEEKPKKKDFDSDEEYEEALKKWEKDNEEDDEDDEDDEENEDYDYYDDDYDDLDEDDSFDTYINEKEKGRNVKKEKENTLKDRILELSS